MDVALNYTPVIKISSCPDKTHYWPKCLHAATNEWAADLISCCLLMHLRHVSFQVCVYGQHLHSYYNFNITTQEITCSSEKTAQNNSHICLHWIHSQHKADQEAEDAGF